MSIHPSYSFSDFDLVLESKDGCLFQVHTIILKRASKFFRDMLSLPRDSEEAATDPIRMDESKEILKAFLDVIYPDYALKISDIASFDVLRTLAHIFADKYDVPAGVATIRGAMMYDTRISSRFSPILLYGLAKELSWSNEATTVSQNTFDIDFSTPAASNYLSQLRGGDVMALLELRRERRKKVQDTLSVVFPRTNIYWYKTCNTLCEGPQFREHVGWRAFRLLVDKKLEDRPSWNGLDQGPFMNDSIVGKLKEYGTCPLCGGTIFTSDMVFNAIREALSRPN